jgi:hypothetical protein
MVQASQHKHLEMLGSKPNHSLFPSLPISNAGRHFYQWLVSETIATGAVQLADPLIFCSNPLVPP